MNRRQVLGGLGAIVGTPVAAYSYLAVTHCGPAETAIEDLIHGSERVRTIKGDIVRLGDTQAVINDGTGDAVVPTRYGVEPAVGKCVWVRGPVVGCIGCRGNAYYFGGLTTMRDDRAELPPERDFLTN